MKNRLTRTGLVVSLALGMILSLGAFAPPPVGAMARTIGVAHISPSAVHTSTLATILQGAHTPAAVHPNCNGSIYVTPSYQSVAAGQTAATHAQWTCQGVFHVVINVDWGDGNTQNYTCSANCSSGGWDIGHTYYSTGNYYPYWNVNGSGSGTYDGSEIAVTA